MTASAEIRVSKNDPCNYTGHDLVHNSFTNRWNVVDAKIGDYIPVTNYNPVNNINRNLKYPIINNDPNSVDMDGCEEQFKLIHPKLTDERSEWIFYFKFVNIF
jgi:hypothetical protein